jgi:DNA processing protein
LVRLGLLLAGGGARCRRVLAGLPDGLDPVGALDRSGAPPTLLRAVRELSREVAPALLDRIAGLGWRWVVPSDDDFPSLLAAISDPPYGLFVRGPLGVAPAVSVVGSRAATPYGRQVARMLGEELGRSGVVVVSGMARGVDACAHRGALAVAGVTWAVWGTGPDRIYPPEHAELAEEIAAAGALVTEYPPGTPPRRYHFPERNRLIAGLAEATVVVEAGVRSGALSTARQAVDEGREVFAVPGAVFSRQSVGPNTLLRLGARPLLTAADVLEVVAPAASDRPTPRRSEADGWLLDGLEQGAVFSPDELAARSGASVAEVLAELLRLELAGVVERLDDGRYARTSGNGPAAPAGWPDRMDA